MRVLVLGASGYVGSRVYADLKTLYETVGSYCHSNNISSGLLQLDITSKLKVDALINEIKPDVIVHAANYSNVDWCDKNPIKARSLNFDATKNIVHAALAIDAKVVFISSLAAGQSNSLYASNKRESEAYIQENLKKTRFLIIRPSVIFGASPFMPDTSISARLGRYVANLESSELDNSWRFYPTHIEDVVNAVLMGIHDKERTSTIDVHVPVLKTVHEIALDVINELGGTNAQRPIESKDSYSEFIRSLARESASLKS